MRVRIDVDFKKIAGKEVPANDKNVRKSMTKAIEKLCESIRKFYKNYKMEIEVSYQIENE